MDTPPSAAELTRLRAWINERIADPTADPEGATTRFTNTELTDIWLIAVSPKDAAAQLWMLKAARYESEISDVEERGTGSERLKLRSLASMVEYARKMADYYSGQGSSSSLVFDIANAPCGSREVDPKRLLGDPAGW